MASAMSATLALGEALVGVGNRRATGGVGRWRNCSSSCGNGGSFVPPMRMRSQRQTGVATARCMQQTARGDGYRGAGLVMRGGKCSVSVGVAASSESRPGSSTRRSSSSTAARSNKGKGLRVRLPSAIVDRSAHAASVGRYSGHEAVNGKLVLDDAVPAVVKASSAKNGAAPAPAASYAEPASATASATASASSSSSSSAGFRSSPWPNRLKSRPPSGGLLGSDREAREVKAAALPLPRLQRLAKADKCPVLFYAPEMESLAKKIAGESVDGSTVELGSIDWRLFPDGYPDLFVQDAYGVRDRHVAFLASFRSPEVIFEQISVIYSLPKMFAASFTLVLPFFPTGTSERVEKEGEIATAVTLARILSNIPPSRGGPCSTLIFDIHALQERFYFGDNILPCFESGIPLLLNRLALLEDADNVVIAYPDEVGLSWADAARRFTDPSFLTRLLPSHRGRTSFIPLLNDPGTS